MNTIKYKLAKKVKSEEQSLKDTLSSNIKKYRNRRKWSQFTLAAKINISTNFLADIEAGNTWVSAKTLVKLAKAFEIKAFELIKPQKEDIEPKKQREIDISKKALSRFSNDMTSVLHESVEKALNHVKKQYEIE